MEIESQNGSKILLLEQGGSEKIDFGRGLGFDRTVSRHHISLKLDEDGTRVYFQVKGKNPIWVRHSRSHDIRVYKTSQRGQFKTGDSFCVSSRNPLWFNFKRLACEEEEEKEKEKEKEKEEDDNNYDATSDGEIRYDQQFAEISGIGHDEIDTRDLSDVDPAKEFNFVVMGHEFDCYQKKLMRDIKNWNWFLEEPDEDSDEEDENGEKKLKKVVRNKRKKGGRGDDDDVWTGESEEDVELIKKSRTDPKPKYSTRLKDKNKKGAGASKSAKDDAKRNLADDDDDDDEEDEDDETLGGFIVDDEDIGEGNEDDDEDIGEGNEDDDEEEEFEEDEDDE